MLRFGFAQPSGQGLIFVVSQTPFAPTIGGPHDAVFCMSLAVGLDHDRLTTLLARIRAVLRPGGMLITMRPTGTECDSPDPLFASTQLLHRLLSRPDLSSGEQFGAELSSTGFGVARVYPLAAAPEMSLYVARAV